MSHSMNHEDFGPTTAYYQGFDAGIEAEQERIITLLLEGKCDDETGCIQCDSINFHIEIIKEAQDD
jgi:hypothetical protein